MPFSTVKNNETFFVAFHVHKANVSTVKKALAAIPLCVSHLKKFKLVFMLFSQAIEQIKIFSETDIHDILDFPINDGFVEGNNILDVLNITNSFDTTGYKKNVFIYNTIDLKCPMNTQYTNALYSVVWLNEWGWLNCQVGVRKPLSFNDIAIDALLGMTLGQEDYETPQRIKVLRLRRIAQILTDRA